MSDGAAEKRLQVEPPVEVCQVNTTNKEHQFVADPPSFRKRRAHRYPPEWLLGPDLYQFLVGVIVAASFGARSATK